MLQSHAVESAEIHKLLETSRSDGTTGHRALGRLIRLVDDNACIADEIDVEIKSSAFRAARIGLTGPPGAGKSSLIASVLEMIAGEGKKIGVLAVDPTSPFSGGAVLGDRVRLKGAVGNNVFFRSLASRGAMGGVSRAIWPASRLLDWWGADIILIETVGSGQLGTGVADVADLVVAVLTPEAGDGIQSMKAGVMELADCFLVNKSDRPGADLIMKELRLVSEEAEVVGRTVEVFQTSAVNGEGIADAVEGVRALWRKLEESGDIAKRRLGQVRRELAYRAEVKIMKRVIDKLGSEEEYLKVLEKLAGKVITHEITPSQAAEEIVSG